MTRGSIVRSKSFASSHTRWIVSPTPTGAGVQPWSSRLSILPVQALPLAVSTCQSRPMTSSGPRCSSVRLAVGRTTNQFNPYIGRIALGRTDGRLSLTGREPVRPTESARTDSLSDHLSPSSPSEAYNRSRCVHFWLPHMVRVRSFPDRLPRRRGRHRRTGRLVRGVGSVFRLP